MGAWLNMNENCIYVDEVFTCISKADGRSYELWSFDTGKCSIMDYEGCEICGYDSMELARRDYLIY